VGQTQPVFNLPGGRHLTPEQESAGDPLPPKCEVIEIHVAELKQLFNAIDPSPFREKDLDPKAEEFIVSWAQDLPADARLALVVYLDRRAGLPEEAAILRDAMHQYFSQRALATRRRLRQLFRVGRTSLAIGITFLAVSLLVGDFVSKLLQGNTLGELLRESLLIGGWVAMWRPMELFLYDWWPIRLEARLFDRLSEMPVRIAYTKDASSEAWRWDWPAVSPSERTPRPIDTRHGSTEQPSPSTPH
jgi:hypothetical protein